MQNLKARCDLFVDFMKNGKFDNVSLDSVNSEKLIKLMDWYVVRLEGGSEEDAAKLLSDEPIRTRIAPKLTEEVKETSVKNEENGAGEEKDSDESSGESGSEGDSSTEDGAKRKKSKPKKAADSLEAELDSNSKTEDKADDAMDADEDGSNDNNAAKRGKKRLRSGGSQAASGGSDGENSDEDEKNDDKDENGGAGGENSNGSVDKKRKPLLATPEQKKMQIDEDDELPQLHRTASVFLRNVAPTITKGEVEGLCKKYSGYLRTAIADPQPEKRWARRAWVTFKRNVNIKGEHTYMLS